LSIAAGVRALVGEARGLGSTIREDVDPASVGPVAVSGMLAEQLVKELGAGASPGAVVVGGVETVARAEALVRIVAGDPTAEDDELVRAADAAGVPVVIVQLWPQADWTAPFVLTPFVVECRTGEGFPVAEIADRIVEATESAVALAARAPVLEEASRSGIVKGSVRRAALIGLVGSRLGASRPLLTLEQVRMLSQLRTGSAGRPASDELQVRAAAAAGVLATGFAFRSVARSLRSALPAPLAHAAVAAAGTWALAKAYELVEPRLRSE
jgi:hypothetical protein